MVIILSRQKGMNSFDKHDHKNRIGNSIKENNYQNDMMMKILRDRTKIIQEKIFIKLSLKNQYR